MQRLDEHPAPSPSPDSTRSMTARTNSGAVCRPRRAAFRGDSAPGSRVAVAHLASPGAKGRGGNRKNQTGSGFPGLTTLLKRHCVTETLQVDSQKARAIQVARAATAPKGRFHDGIGTGPSPPNLPTG